MYHTSVSVHGDGCTYIIHNHQLGTQTFLLRPRKRDQKCPSVVQLYLEEKNMEVGIDRSNQNLIQRLTVGLKANRKGRDSCHDQS